MTAESRVPNMLRHDWDRDGTCRICGVKYQIPTISTACPGKPKAEQTPAPRIDLAVGDAVAWTTAGQGKVVHLFDGIDNARIAVVHVAGWWATPEGYLTRTDTGVPAVLEIVAADLRKQGGL